MTMYVVDGNDLDSSLTISQNVSSEEQVAENGLPDGTTPEQTKDQTEDNLNTAENEQPAQEATDAAEGPVAAKDGQNMMDMMNGGMPFPGMNGFPMDPNQMMNMGVMGRSNASPNPDKLLTKLQAWIPWP